jgi:hypothetical protein
MKLPKILFIPVSSCINTGSYRIWIHDLSNYWSEIGIASKIGKPSDIPDYDIVICGKGGDHIAREAKAQNKKAGLINPVGGKDYNIDFIIAGSLEEKDSLSKNKNVFIFPLIEKLFQDKVVKQHKNTDTLRVCFHGHYPHLSKFEPHLKEALEEFSQEKPVELLTIHGASRFKWEYGRPNIKVLFKAWNRKTIVDEILSCDIGLCPNATDLSHAKLPTSTDRGLYDTDYALRFKNKSNAGRAFVFHQLGIPTIADFTPSHFHILGDPDNGYIAMSKEGWLGALRDLSCPSHRNFIASNARKEFDRLYNPLDWAQKLYTSINKIK